MRSHGGHGVAEAWGQQRGLGRVLRDLGCGGEPRAEKGQGLPRAGKGRGLRGGGWEGAGSAGGGCCPLRAVTVPHLSADASFSGPHGPGLRLQTAPRQGCKWNMRLRPGVRSVSGPGTCTILVSRPLCPPLGRGRRRPHLTPAPGRLWPMVSAPAWPRGQVYP